LVHESIETQFLQLVRGKIAKLRVGRSIGFQNDIGPFTYQPQKNTLKSQLDEVGASQVYDGVANFMIPTVLKVEPGSRLWRDESFGPILVYRTFKTEAEAIEQANDTSFGLGSVIWSRDTSKARQMATKLRAGTVVINDAPHTHALFALPWGGLGDSGIGRVHGAEGLREMSHSQVVCFDLFGQWKQFWWFPYTEAQFQFLKNYTLFLAEARLAKRLKALLKTCLCFFRLDRRL
jgi:succinate-semialdehyde dehydrogenase/glutarate-semialdehyde dehydrogenase